MPTRVPRKKPFLHKALLRSDVLWEVASEGGYPIDLHDWKREEMGKKQGGMSIQEVM